MDYTPNSTTHPINKNRQLSENLFRGNLNLFTISSLFVTEIDNLANKMAIKKYHKHNFNQLLEVLKKNRNKLSLDPSDRKTQELLENQFIKSMLILEPLKARIKETDELIDEIVYRLYGLTGEEIKIVKREGRF